MKLRFDWGTGIVTAIIVIIAGLAVMVGIAVKQDYYLVDKNYYQKGVQYQQHIKKMKNTGSLVEKISYTLNANSLTFKIPACADGSLPEGEVYFYSPVNPKNDYKVILAPDDSMFQAIDLNNLAKGRYVIKIDWSCDTVGYYQELNVTVN